MLFLHPDCVCLLKVSICHPAGIKLENVYNTKHKLTFLKNIGYATPTVYPCTCGLHAQLTSTQLLHACSKGFPWFVWWSVCSLFGSAVTFLWHPFIRVYAAIRHLGGPLLSQAQWAMEAWSCGQLANVEGSRLAVAWLLQPIRTSQINSAHNASKMDAGFASQVKA